MDKKKCTGIPARLRNGRFDLCHFLTIILVTITVFSIFGCSSLQSTGIIDMENYKNLSRTIRTQIVAWEKVASFTFDDPKDIESYRIVEGKWGIHNGKLWAIEGDRNRAILLTPCSYNPVRIDFEATDWSTKGLMGDITVLLNSTPDKNFFNSGYALTTGSFWNNCTSFYKRGQAIANTNYSPVKSGKTNRITLEFNSGHITYWMNGEILLEAWDDTPLTMDSSAWIGIRTWSTRMCIDNLDVYKGTPIKKISKE
ncbi:MAG: family 16 glycoside hydrolase [Candidatus Latescibacterota bacterium]